VFLEVGKEKKKRKNNYSTVEDGHNRMIRFLTKAVDKFPRSLQELYCRFNLKKGKLKI
jgi:hypothetical protein